MSGAIRQMTITGRVQGVGYRAWIMHQAMARGLDGWVRNRRDGSVEALFAGPEEVVSDMVMLCRRGPAYARVAAAFHRRFIRIAEEASADRSAL